MLSLWKSTSRTVHHHNDEEHEPNNNYKFTSNNHEEESCISLTVWRKSLLFSCKGFTVIGSDGNLAYRVDNYRHTPNQTVLMDASGNPIFTICRRKKLNLVDKDWFVYEGEVDSSSSSSPTSKKPVLYVRKNTSILRMKQSVLAYVYDGMSEKGSYAYMIEGSYVHRSCKILDVTKRVVAEIRRKEALKGCGVSFGLEVFHLVVMPGIDSRYAMAIVLLLDQMFS